MEEDSAMTVYNGSAITDAKKNPFSIKVGLAQMLRRGAILEVTILQQAKIAEDAGACYIMVAEPTRQGIRRMPDPSLIKDIKRAVSIPSEILATANEDNFINKHNFRCPFICRCQNLGEALRRVREGAAMIRTQGEVLGHGNIAETVRNVRNVRNVMKEVRVLNNMDEDEVFAFAKKKAAPCDLVAQTKQMGRLPVAQFAAGGIVTPADAALMMQLVCDGIFAGNEVFYSAEPNKLVRAIVQAVRHYNDPHVLVESICGLEDSIQEINPSEDRIQHFGRD
ncbi:hypothetical protein GH714_034822 [Hevea brasiliensis]|uniref:PdxS/SNZ N-terminal domain-containing protein n=1 Tax=Hevea brasiliensis TaxID=3981 RepID=A0A6A6NE35_HEVBR|nr:hypothetical protein GH714_034822 [Hevea brasiliensis]